MKKTTLPITLCNGLLLNKIKFIGNDKQGLFLLDRELGMRSADNQ